MSIPVLVSWCTWHQDSALQHIFLVVCKDIIAIYGLNPLIFLLHFWLIVPASIEISGTLVFPECFPLVVVV